MWGSCGRGSVTMFVFDSVTGLLVLMEKLLKCWIP